MQRKRRFSQWVIFSLLILGILSYTSFVVWDKLVRRGGNYDDSTSYDNLIISSQSLRLNENLPFSPTYKPSAIPTSRPSSRNTGIRTFFPTVQPSSHPSRRITAIPTFSPTVQPSDSSTAIPTFSPTVQPSDGNTAIPTFSPTAQPSEGNSTIPTFSPTAQPSEGNSTIPTFSPTAQPSEGNSTIPTFPPTVQPSSQPSTTNQPNELVPSISYSPSARVNSTSASQSETGGLVVSASFLYLSISIFFVAMIVISFILFVRAESNNNLTKLKSCGPELFDVCMKCFLIGVSIYQLTAAIQNIIIFLILIVVRLIILGNWFYLMYLFFEPLFVSSINVGEDNSQQNDIEESTASSQQQDNETVSSKTSRRAAYLFQLVHSEYISGGNRKTAYSILAILCMFDGTLFRLFPWRQTNLTDKLEGYPNVSVLRSCLYSSIAAQVVQAIATITSTVSAAASDSSWALTADTIILVFVVINAARNVMIIFLQEIIILQDDQVYIVDSRELDTIEEAKKFKQRYGGDTDDNQSVSTLTDTENPILKSELGDEVDERGLPVVATTPYADESLNIMKKQLLAAGVQPIFYRPLNELQTEIQTIIERMNEGTATEQEQTDLDYLLYCLENHPEYIEQKKQETVQWRKNNQDFISDCLQETRNYIPSYIFKTTMKQLIDEEGMDPSIAKRIFTKKCLWLVRISSEDLGRIHFAELKGRFNYEGQGLDLVELAAIYGALPEQFTLDPQNMKEKWKLNLEKSLKDLLAKKEQGKLTKNQLRNPVYQKQDGLYEQRRSLFKYLDSMKSKDVAETLEIKEGAFVRNALTSQVDEVDEKSVNNIFLQPQRRIKIISKTTEIEELRKNTPPSSLSSSLSEISSRRKAEKIEKNIDDLQLSSSVVSDADSVTSSSASLLSSSRSRVASQTFQNNQQMLLNAIKKRSEKKET